MARIGGVLAALLLGACAGLNERRFTLGIDLDRDDRRQFWPAQTTREVPRYVYVGTLIGEANFIKPKGEQESFLGTLGRLLEFIQGEAPPKRLDRPQSGMVVAGGRILVTDLGRGAVFVFDEQQARLDTWELADGLRNFIAPVGIAPGPDGQVFVADADLALVARLDRQGNPLPAIGKGQLKRPNGLAFDPANRRLYVADTAAHQIKVFDLDGNLLSTWGGRGDQHGQFSYPTHIAVRDERLYVSDTINARVQILSTATGEPVGTIGKRGLYVGNLVRPKGVAVDSEHNVYVIESYFDHLLVYNRHGEFLMPIGGVGNLPGRFHLPSGVWLDGRNRLFIADTLNSRVSVFQFLGGGSENE